MAFLRASFGADITAATVCLAGVLSAGGRAGVWRAGSAHSGDADPAGGRGCCGAGWANVPHLPKGGLRWAQGAVFAVGGDLVGCDDLESFWRNVLKRPERAATDWSLCAALKRRPAADAV